MTISAITPPTVTLELAAPAQRPNLAAVPDPVIDEHPSPIARVEYLGEFIDERVNISTPHLSPSHLRDRQYCSAQNWYVRRHGLSKATGSSLLRGIAIHHGLSKALAANKTTIELGRQHPIDLGTFIAIAQRAAYQRARLELSAAMREHRILWEHRWQKGPLMTYESVIYDVFRAIKIAGPHFYANIYPLSVEAAFLIHWKAPNIYPLLCVADIINLRDDHTIGLLDIKTSIKRKSIMELALDRGLIAYAAGTSAEFGVQVKTLGYENITFTSPGRYAKIRKPTITQITTELPYEPPTLDTLLIESADAMLDIRDSRVTPRRSTQTCPKCPFADLCSKDFGAIHSALLAPAPSTEDDDE